MSESKTMQRQGTTRRASSGAFSRWMQRTMNARVITKIRGNGGRFKGMDLLILHTAGRRSGQARQSPLAWFPDGDAWLVVASGGGERHPGWYLNLIAHPERAAAELPGGGDPVAVTPSVLEGAAREQAWQRIATVQPRIAKYQRKTERRYPVIRLVAR